MDDFVAVYTSCFKKYATFSGRAARKEYAIFVLTNMILSILLGLVPVVGPLFGLATIIPTFAVTSRRLHDLNKSGWWQLAPYGILVLGLISAFSAGHFGSSWSGILIFMLGGGAAFGLFIWLLFGKGTSGENRFGADPRVCYDNTGETLQTVQIKARLEEAKKMFDEGAISESEYQTMRSKIIDKL